MSDKNKSGVLNTCLAKPEKIVRLVEYSADSVVSKTVIDKGAGTITVFSFDKGQGLSEHTAAYDAVVEVIEGKALVTIAGKESELLAGEIIIMPASVPHSVRAQEKFKMLLIMIRE